MAEKQTQKKPVTALLVDDDSFMIDLYVRKGKKNNITIQGASTGKEALDLLRDGLAPDVLIVDITLPDMDGFELLEQIQTNDLLHSAHVIFLTNRSEAETMQQAQRMPVDRYIVKANTLPSEVVEEISKLVQART